ncbi:isocitrate lyase/phosphoenolpyruvate mutase family protein [Streptomyces sp. NPDC004561]
MIRRRTYPSFRTVLSQNAPVRVAGAHDALGAKLAEQAGFQAVWSSSLEVSAARCLPDASLLSMTEYLQAAAHMQSAIGIPVVADCDTGYGNTLNVVHMVHEYEAAGITAVCMEDKLFPKMNSFAEAAHDLLAVGDFTGKLEAAKKAQSTEDFFVIARTEALISGLGVDEAVTRCTAYADAGADAVLVHSKQPTNGQVLDFLERWDGRVPVVIVPTTYPDWTVDDAAAAGVSVVIYANQGMRATVTALRDTFNTIYQYGSSKPIEDEVVPVKDIFSLQRLDEWTAIGA